jgi:trigger factor
MQVSVEQSDGLKRRMKVEIPADVIDQEVDEKLKSLTKTIKVDGFRPGKVPLRVVKQRFSEGVREEVVGKRLQLSMQEAMEQEKIDMVGQLEIEDLQSEPGKDLVYTAVFEIMPEVKPVGMDEISIEKIVATVEEPDVDNMLVTLRKQHCTWDAVDRPSEEGDRVSFKHLPEDGEEDKQSGKLILGGHEWPAVFEESLTGVVVGQEIEINHEAGMMKVEVDEVSSSELAPLDADFAKQFGIADGDLDALRQSVKDNMSRELDSTLRNSLRHHVLDELHKINPIPVPEALVQQELAQLKKQHDDEHQHQHDENCDHSELDAELAERARKRVGLGLLVAAVIQGNNMEAEEEKVLAKIQEITAPYQDAGDVAKWYREDPKQRKQIEFIVMEDQVVDFVLEQAQVTEKQQSFDDVMGGNS